jgi:small-conductance mechanosensitive channel
MKFLDLTLAGMTVRNLALGAGTALCAFFVLRGFQAILASRLTSFAKRTSTEWDDVIAAALRKTHAVFLALVALYIGCAAFIEVKRIHSVLGTAVVLGLIVQAGLWVNAGVSSWLESYRLRKLDKDAAAVTTVGAIGFLARLAVWIIVLLLALDNLGIEITALIAGLGVGGIAIALAVQNILGDLFASLSIVLDKPFVVGDFLIIDGFLGTVEKVGIKTTRMRSLSGEQLVFSNNDLLSSRLRNFGRMYQRRVLFSIGVTYQTPRGALERIPGIIRNAIESQGNTRFDRSHFKEYGDSSLVFESVYFVLVPEYAVYMDVQQAVNFKIHEEFEREGIEFAYPTRTIFLARSEENPDGRHGETAQPGD